MEAAEEILTYRDATGLHKKLLPGDKTYKDTDGKDHAAEIKSDESNYVDLNVKPDGAKTVRVSFTGDGNQLSVVKCDSSKQKEPEREGENIFGHSVGEQLGDDMRAPVPGPDAGESPSETLIKLPGTAQDSENERRRPAELEQGDWGEHVCSESDELQYTDMYLNSRTESDDGASAVLSDHCGSDAVEDESHYITTHEIQLTELDHDVDYDLGRGTCWDFEDNNLVYSFVDYASFESDETREGTLILEGRSRAKAQSDLVGAVASTEQEEDSDLCDSDKCASSDESLCKDRGGDVNKGEISVNASSGAVNEPVNMFDRTTGDRSRFSAVSRGATAPPMCDGAKYFIPAPGRQHLATKLRRKDINEYSSGASSSISELDDADKEVRNLTAKSFRSLACPYFDAINLSTSSESSMSEYRGLNKWSAYWKYGNMPRGRERGVIAHKTSSATLEMNKIVDNKMHGKSIAGMKAPPTKLYALNKRTTSQHSSSSSTLELRDPIHSKQSGITLNVRCNVDKPEGARRPKCSKKARANEVSGTVLARSGCKVQYHHTESTGGTQKRAVFASSLLKNVISKKMQFEQERNMERGELCDTRPALSPSFQFKDEDGMKDRSQLRAFRRQPSESGSEFTISADDEHFEGSRANSCEPTAEYKSNKAPDDSIESQLKASKAPIGLNQNTAFRSLKVGVPKEAEPVSVSDPQTAEKERLDTSSMLTKLLFVPSWQLFSKEKAFSEDFLNCGPSIGTPAGPQKCEKEFKTDNNGYILGKGVNEKAGKNPEIKICLRSVKENKGCTLNIASLLTPNISYNNVNTFRVAGNAKCHIFSASDKIPSFTVRDIRDTKCKFQTPIYHVRDVRKLVKSSYQFVSLDTSDSKCSAAADRHEEKGTNKEPVKPLSPSPIVIKCQSVKTNAKQQTAEVSEKQAGIPACKTSTASRVSNVPSSQLHPDQSEPNTETKLTRQRFAGEAAERRNEYKIPKQAALEKLKAAVKTMEQLYVYDRNEWKRKTQAPQPITDSHVLSLIAREEQADVTETAGKPQESKGALNIVHVPHNADSFPPQSQSSETFSKRSILHVGNNKARVSIAPVTDHRPQSSAPQTSSTMKSSGPRAAPHSVKVETLKDSQVEQGKVNIIPANPAAAQDSENYLSIPGLRGHANEIRPPNREPDPGDASSSASRIKKQERRSPASSIYINTGATAGPQAQQQVLYLSPSVSAMSPTPSAGQPVTQTQRKMLLDPTTGHYYLVDTPTQAATKRLFDPETGQYVDVPMPHAPVSPVAPVTRVPLSLPPLALSPGPYAPAYVICPGFIPSPTLPAQAALPRSPCHSVDGSGEKVKTARSPRPKTNAPWGESAYYSATGGEAPRGALQLPVTARGGAASSERKPVISITTQQGPRIIAPPSFDGTTMSFVVEHR